MRIQHFLLGYEDLEICPRHRTCFLNLCRSSKWAYLPLRTADDESILVRCTLPVATPMRRACQNRGIGVRVVERGGLPIWLHRYRMRAGLLLGGLASIFLLYSLLGVVWDIRIYGNSAVSEAEIREQLRACGLQEGSSLRGEGIDCRELENRLLRASPDISWVSVNLRGTVANVQVRERQVGQSALSPEDVNLVAACDGIISSVRLLTGEVVVKPGQEVRRGELLISGVRDSKAHGYSVVGARGEVMAQTEHTEIVRIPLQEEQKVYTGEEKCEKSIIFFKKSIKFSKNTGIIGGSCDTIYRIEPWVLPSGAKLPVGYAITRYLPYTMQTVERTQAESYAMALAQMERILQERADGALLLHKTLSVSYSETHCILVCEYRCLENIAVASPPLEETS